MSESVQHAGVLTDIQNTVKERRGYSHLREEALDRTTWRAGFGRGFGPAVRPTTDWTCRKTYYLNEYACLLLLAPMQRCNIPVWSVSGSCAC